MPKLLASISAHCQNQNTKFNKALFLNNVIKPTSILFDPDFKFCLDRSTITSNTDMAKSEVDSPQDSSTPVEMELKPAIAHEEDHLAAKAGWKVSKTGDGDTAMALFDNIDDLAEPLSPEEERKLVRKVDFMILPCLMVCYCFFYIDKVRLGLFSCLQQLY